MKKEGKLLQMVWLCLEENEECTGKKNELIQVERVKKSRGKQKITLVKVLKKKTC